MDQVNDEIVPESPAYSGFVAMEYYALIWNRTFVVFAGSEGLYGWRACGAVTNADNTYYEPYAQLLEDEALMRDRLALAKLAHLPGGFTIPRESIASAEASYKQKMGYGWSSSLWKSHNRSDKREKIVNS